VKPILLSLLTLGLTLVAQDPGGPAAPSADTNSVEDAKQAVARISLINGVVSVRRGDSGEAVAAALNAPLTGTDRLLTGEGSRVELQFDGVNMIRLAPSTEVRIGELAYHHYQVQIAAGTTEFRVFRDNDAEIEISTPSVAIHPLKKGVYRVTVKADGTTEVTVRQGEAEISSPKGTEKLGSGKTMEARGTSGDPEFQIIGAVAADQWDTWNHNRDQDLEKTIGRGGINPDINGTEELDNNGRWVDDAAYGQVWVPNAPPNWAPYQVGRWAWVDGYGWTWVSSDPWGWAPYHYGRWYVGSYGWTWWPGMISGPCYWQPALVGFFGWGGFGVGFGFGNVGWVPLAPYERFYRGYGVGFGGVAVIRNVNVTNIYRNARVANGVTSMTADRFGRGGVNGTTSVRATSADLARAGSVRGALPVTPSRESTRFSNTSVAGAVHSSENSHFYSSHPSNTTARPSFDQQRQQMANTASRVSRPAPVSPGATPHLSGPPTSTSQGTNSVATHTASPAAAPTPAGGWTKFNGNNGNNSGTASSTAAAGRSIGSNSSPQSVRINPSVVQNRTSSTGAPAKSGSAPSRGGSTGGGGGSRGGSSPSPSHGSPGGGGRR
jgi:hypothetical protein